MKTSAILSLLGLGATLASAHMEMTEPAPFRSKSNKFATQKDYDMTSPLAPDGSNFPCKGYLSDFGTPAGASVATYSPGQSYKFTINGGASHNGGSCQASLSYDKGKTWTVIHSYIGNCPLQGSSSFDFTIPSDTPAGEAIFSWSWFNKVGNREMYQNCAAVTIGGGKRKRAPSDSFKSRPAMFVANVGNGCGTLEGKDVMFPNPGPDVTNNSQGTAPPTGNCAGGSGGGSGGGSNGGSNGGSGGGAGSAPAPPAKTTKAPVQKPSATAPGGVFITSAPAGGGQGAPSAPTTLITLTNPVAPPPAATQTPGTPKAGKPPAVNPPSTPAPTNPPSGGGSGGMPAGQACTNEGDWNCVGGTRFQRCASGRWSVLMPMAAGTTCKEGMGSSFAFGAKGGKKRAVRYARSLRF